MEAQIAIAKIGKYATSESGDTLEMIERPGGGLSCVLVDGQRSGKSAKTVSNVVTRKAISLLADGVRDGAVARAASDYLYTYRTGKVMATLNILSIDLQSRTLVIVRNNPAPVIFIQEDNLTLLDEPAEAIGVRRGIRPSINEISLAPNIAAIAYTDGLSLAGDRTGHRMDIVGCVEGLMDDDHIEPKRWAGHLLHQAITLDQGRPADDISVLIVAILPRQEDDVRYLSARMPF